MQQWSNSCKNNSSMEFLMVKIAEIFKLIVHFNLFYGNFMASFSEMTINNIWTIEIFEFKKHTLFYC